MSNPRVDILLATYQGAAYLAELLASIRSQTFADWRLLARDDGSDDATVRILREVAACDRRFALVEPDGIRRGPAGNFGLLMERAWQDGTDYFFFADQDDVWHADKVTRQLQGLRDAETVAPGPQLVFCDASVVDARRRPMHSSFLRQNRLPYNSSQPLKTLLGRSFVLGCACAVNRSLVEFALPLPVEIASHDWWLALCAACVGQIHCMDVPLLEYRRHEANASAAAFWKAGSGGGIRRRWDVGWRSFLRSLDQAHLLRDRLHHRGTARSEAGDLLAAFCSAVDRSSRWQRLRQLRWLGVPALDWPRRMIYDLCVLRDR